MLAGALKVTVACVSPAVALTPVGMPGAPTGVALLEGAEDGLTPIPLVAVTVKVYATPLVRPLTVIGAAAGPATVPVKPPGLEVAM